MNEAYLKKGRQFIGAPAHEWTRMWTWGSKPQWEKEWEWPRHKWLHHLAKKVMPTQKNGEQKVIWVYVTHRPASPVSSHAKPSLPFITYPVGPSWNEPIRWVENKRKSVGNDTRFWLRSHSGEIFRISTTEVAFLANGLGNSSPSSFKDLVFSILFMGNLRVGRKNSAR